MKNQTRIPPKPPGRPPMPNAQAPNNQVIKPAEGVSVQINIQNASPAPSGGAEPQAAPTIKRVEVVTTPQTQDEKKQPEKKEEKKEPEKRVKKEKAPKVKTVKPKKEKVKKPMTLNRGLFWGLIALAGVFSVLLIVLICLLNVPIDGLS